MNALMYRHRMKYIKQNKGRHRFGNEYYEISFDEDLDLDNIPEYGAKYIFSLDKAVDKVPEFLVSPLVLQKYCYILH